MYTGEKLATQMLPMYRGPMTFERYDKIINSPGMYDIITKSNGKSDYVLDHDQIGFNIKKNDGMLRVDAALIEGVGVQKGIRGYEIMGYLNKENSVDLGFIPVDENSLDSRRKVQETIYRLYSEIIEKGLPTMSIKERVGELLTVNQKTEKQSFTPLPVRVKFSKS